VIEISDCLLISTLELGDADYLKRDFPSLAVDDLNHMWPAIHPDGNCNSAQNPDDAWKKEVNQPRANKGQEILTQQQQGWNAKVIDRLAKD
jgi:hypothetical protein